MLKDFRASELFSTSDRRYRHGPHYMKRSSLLSLNERKRSTTLFWKANFVRLQNIYNNMKSARISGRTKAHQSLAEHFSTR